MQKFWALLFILSSCSFPKPINDNSNFEECLPKQFVHDLNLLTKSMDDFIKRNKRFGTLEKYIEFISAFNLPHKIEFSKKDLALANQLSQNNFRDYIYTELEIDLEGDSDIIMEPSSTADESDTSTYPKTQLRVDIEKPFLNCIDQLHSKGKFVEIYLGIQKSQSLSPLIVGKLFLDEKDNDDFQPEIAKKILAAECYFLILEAVNKYK